MSFVNNLPWGGSGDGGGLNLNGIIEQYLSGSSGIISAGDFVVFADNKEDRVYSKDFGVSSVTPFTVPLGSPTSTPSNMKVVSFGENTAIVVYNDNDMDSGSFYIKAAFITVLDNHTINIGEPVAVSTKLSLGYNEISVQKISNTKLFVVYQADTRPCGVVLSISGTTITVGTRTTADETCTSITSAVLTGSNILVVFGSTESTKAVIVSVASVTPSFGTAYAVNSVERELRISVVPLTSTRALLCCYDRKVSDPQASLICILLTISGSTITVSTDNVIATTPHSYFHAVALSANTVLVCYSNYLDGGRGYAKIITVSDSNTITVGEAVKITDTSFYYCSLTQISTNSVAVMYLAGTQGRLIMLTVSGTRINTDLATLIDTSVGNDLCIASLINKRIVFAYKSLETSLNIVSFVFNQTTKIAGVAVDDGGNGDIISVCVPTVSPIIFSYVNSVVLFGAYTAYFSENTIRTASVDNEVLLVMQGAKSSIYENIKFVLGSVPSGSNISLKDNYTGTAFSPDAPYGILYGAIIQNVNQPIDIVLNVNEKNDAYDYFTVTINITYA